LHKIFSSNAAIQPVETVLISFFELAILIKKLMIFLLLPPAVVFSFGHAEITDVAVHCIRWTFKSTTLAHGFSCTDLNRIAIIASIFDCS